MLPCRKNAYSTNETLSNDTKINKHMALSFSSIIKINVLDFVGAGALVFLKHILLARLHFSAVDLLLYPWRPH